VEEFWVNQTDALPGDGVALSGKQGGIGYPWDRPGISASRKWLMNCSAGYFFLAIKTPFG